MDDLFKRYSRTIVETRDAVQVTEENILDVAKELRRRDISPVSIRLFGGGVDSGCVRLALAAVDSVPVGEHVDTEGRRVSLSDGWGPTDRRGSALIYANSFDDGVRWSTYAPPLGSRLGCNDLVVTSPAQAEGLRHEDFGRVVILRGASPELFAVARRNAAKSAPSAPSVELGTPGAPSASSVELGTPGAPTAPAF